ncbi:MAG: HNH endonuclease domain-containing protein, partial [Candidatus Micrarchaeaceae archaeon]
ASAMQLERLRPHPPTGNVVVDVALRQFRYQFNMMIDTIGEPPSQVIVELAREIKLGITRRKELEKKNAMNMKNKQAARKELESQGIVPTDRHVERYLRWKEQETCCPYCERKISFDEAMNGNATNLDHIIPRSLTRVGRQSKHLLLVHRSCNDEKGDRTPYQQWGQDPDRWKVIEDHAELLRRKRLYEKARLLTLKDFEMDVVDDAAINDFSERQFHETSWIAKLVTQWVRTVCPNVSPSRGAFTAYLRRHWKLETVIPQVRIEENLPLFSLEARDSNTSEAPENRVITPEEFERLRPIWEGHQPADDTTTPRHFDKRIDHRHHFIDALVIAMTSRSLYQKMARAWKESYERRQRPSFAVPPPIENLRKQALEIVRQCNLTHKPDRYPSGALFKDTAYGVTQSDPRHPDSQVDRLVLREDVKELTRKDCENIVHPSTRDYLLKHFSGQQSPSGPLEHPNFHTPIKKVRVAQPLSASGPMVRRIEHRPKSAGRSVTLYKYLAGKEYAYVEVGYDEKRKVNVRLVTLFEADRSKHVDHHNETRRFYKGDTVIFKSRRFLIKKIHALSNGANAQLFLVPITETRTADDIARLQGKLNPRPSDLLRVSGKALLQLQRV